MKPEYEPTDLTMAMGYLVEECGEVLAAAGKSIRWGLDSYNPELVPEDQEANRDWLEREMRDLGGAIRRVRKFLKDGENL